VDFILNRRRGNMKIEIKESKSEFSKIYAGCICDSEIGKMIINDDKSIDYIIPGFTAKIMEDEYIIIK